MKSTLEIKGMTFFAHHGCYPFEREKGGDYLVDFACELPSLPSADEISETVDCEQVYKIVAEEMSVPCNLIETLAQRIVFALQRDLPQLRHFSIKVIKLNPPLPSQTGESSVTVEV